ncbi:hypothetical protein SmJEL517_g00774 [Synchytrium microbalum]|uniref:EML-like first beta-propeller domain-containing protein n=1 Tax=Synchytrium microbalum TaxID=1806994 RepID=A0A507CIY1_9FUNG|nr:uncharacterized protein SmJEL517_g00774 [Synchytrium microbalum]TPX37653.1 hypothetical protein SmJEL517_g00774 [Synchytrium microbalum]
MQQDVESASVRPSNMNLGGGSRLFLDDNIYKIEDLQDASKKTSREMDNTALKLYASFGFEATRKSHLHFLDETTLMSAVGNVLVFINLKNMQQTYFEGFRDGGIGAMALHPSRKLIAVAEIHEPTPRIYLLEYPSLDVRRVLTGGAVRGYSAICFDSTGERLASVATDPDYTLTIWDWQREMVVLRSKAFAQDVANVAFAPSSNQLTTSGSGHIKFWRASSTFTGLKLVGQLGKFGATELSDIASFSQFPDGKVLSSTEFGNLLLWEGNTIKCEIMLRGKKPCHQGQIHSVMMEEGEVLTAGDDGFIRMWDFETIDGADVSDDPPAAAAPASSGENGVAGGGNAPVAVSSVQARIFEIEPLDEILIGKDVQIKAMARCLGPGSNDYIVLDSCGALYRVDIRKHSVDRLMSFHSGAIHGLDASPLLHHISSIGVDGTIRVYDLIARTLADRIKYPAGGSFLAYLPPSLDAAGRTLVTGFEDGVMKIMSHGTAGLAPGADNNAPSNATLGQFTLHYVFKPHTKPITQISVSVDGTFLASASLDKTVFFFRLKRDSALDRDTLVFSRDSVSVTLVGFIELDAAPTCITFLSGSSNGDELATDSAADLEPPTLLIVLEDGRLCTVIPPIAPISENPVTYRLPKSVEVMPWVLDIPVVPGAVIPDTIAVEEVEDVSGEQGDETQPDEIAEVVEAVAAPPERLSTTRKLRGLGLPPAPRVTSAVALDGGLFVLALINSANEGEIRSCRLSTPNTSRLLLVHTSSFSSVKISTSGRYLIATSLDGTTAMRPIEGNDLVPNEGWQAGHETYAQAAEIAASNNSTTGTGDWWYGHAHGVRGVKCITSTFDDAFLCSGGEEGGIFVWKVLDEEVRENEAFDDGADRAEWEGNATSEEDGVEDILDPKAYSIEEAKVKSGKDKELQDAELKKQMTREQILELRNEFQKLVTENEKAPAGQQIEIEDLIVDPYLNSEMEEDARRKLREVELELAWAAEKETIGVNKLKAKFIDPLQTERVQISSFKTHHIISTFRTVKLVAADEDLGGSPETRDRHGTAVGGPPRTATFIPASRDHEGNHGPTKKISSKAAAVSKLEARKAARAERVALWKELMASQPDENQEDRRDVAAIKKAEITMGDFKLKTGADYAVPEHERTNADKKRRQAKLLRQSVFDIKEQFNQQVFEMRDQKIDLIGKINRWNQELITIDQELDKLGQKRGGPIVQLTMEETAFPSRRNNVTAEDIAALKIEEAKAASDSRGGDPLGGFGDGGGGAKPPAQAATSSEATTNVKPVDASASDSLGSEEILARSNQPRTILERREEELKVTMLLYRRDRINKAIQDAISKFDTQLQALHKEKLTLEGDMKFAEMRLLLLQREWRLLKELEQFDNEYVEKLQIRQAEKDDIDSKVQECQEKLASKKQEVEDAIQHEREIQEEFAATLGENNRHEEILTKIFKKKIRRSKKKQQAKTNQDAPSDDSESDVDDYDYDDAMSDENMSDSGEQASSFVPDACPPYCEVALYNKVLELREKRLDQEDGMAEIQKAIDALRKENEALMKKEKVIDQALKLAAKEIEDFQTQKQHKLNELDVIVPLALHQIMFGDKPAIPTDLSTALVFLKSGLTKLRNRVGEIEQEKAEIRMQHQELKRHHVSLVRSKREKDAKLQELETRTNDVQILKFGRVVDVEKLEKMGVNKSAEDMKDKLSREDRKRSLEVAAVQMDMDRLKQRYTDLTKQNTERVESLMELTKGLKQLEDALNSNQGSMAGTFPGSHNRKEAEQEKLQKLVAQQGAQLEQLRTEVEFLLRKPLHLPVLSKNANSTVAARPELPVAPPAE